MPAFLNQMEQKWSDVHFIRVDAEIADNLVDKQEAMDAALTKEEADNLKALFESQYRRPACNRRE